MCLWHERLEKRHQHYPTPTVSGFQGRDRPSYQWSSRFAGRSLRKHASSQVPGQGPTLLTCSCRVQPPAAVAAIEYSFLVGGALVLLTRVNPMKEVSSANNSIDQCPIPESTNEYLVKVNPLRGLGFTFSCRVQPRVNPWAQVNPSSS